MIDLKRLRKENNLTQKDLQDILGYSQPFISQIEKGERDIPDEGLRKLISKFANYKQYLAETQESIAVNQTNHKHLRFTGVPYYDLDVTGSITGSFSDIKEVPEFHVDFKPFNDCTAYLPIYGDSMYPQFCSGEIIAIKEWRNTDVVLWGEPYLIITNSECNNLRTIKLVFQAEDPEYIILRASNPNFKGDTLIPKRCILSMYIIKGKITRKQL